MTNQPPDCGTCREAECPDRGQPHNMRGMTEEECAVTIAGSDNDESPPAEEMVSGAGGPGASPGHASQETDAECAWNALRVWATKTTTTLQDGNLTLVGPLVLRLLERADEAAMWEFAARKMTKQFLDDMEMFKTEARDRWFEQILRDLQVDYKAGRE